ncbi:MAG: sulfurtransferase TusA family protein [Nitrospirota bacterium]
MADKILDLKGLVCPRPMVITMSTMKTMERGQTLEVLCTDITTKNSIPALCERSGYKLLKLKDENGLVTFCIQK